MIQVHEVLLSTAHSKHSQRSLCTQAPVHL